MTRGERRGLIVLVALLAIVLFFAIASRGCGSKNNGRAGENDSVQSGSAVLLLNDSCSVRDSVQNNKKKNRRNSRKTKIKIKSNSYKERDVLGDPA